jgi:hypothetical protein
VIVDIPALAAAIGRKQEDVKRIVDGYDVHGVPAGWEQQPRKGEPQRALFVRTHITTDLAAAATRIGSLLDLEPMLSGNRQTRWFHCF